MGISSAGIGSNLDIESIIASLMNVERKPLNTVTAQKTTFQTKLSAFGTFKSALASFQTNLSQLAKSTNLNPKTATAGDSTLFTATANGQATNTQYNLQVNRLAQANKLAAQGFAATSDAVGTGVMTIDFGTHNDDNNTFSVNGGQPPLTITIDNSNNTLAGLRNAINAANSGVTASIINDGQTNGNRLVLTAKDTGLANTLRVSVVDDDGLNVDNTGLSRFAHNPLASLGNGKNLAILQTAENALLSIDNIQISKPTNTITDAIAGVTLNLLKEGGASTALTVSQDNTAVTKLIESFVKGYNDLNNTVRNLTRYDESGKNNGALLGDSATRNIMTQIKQTLTGTLGHGELNTLSQIGVAFQRDGNLLLDKTKLTTMLDTKPQQVSNLLSTQGSVSDALLRFNGNSSATKPGSYAVNVTSLATQTKLSGSVSPNLTISADVNNTFSLMIAGASYAITLTPDVYADTDALATDLQNQLLAAGAPVNATVENGSLALTSKDFGANLQMRLTSGNAIEDLFGTPAVVLGQAAAGTINGTEATGLGRSLIGGTGNDANGLIVQVLGGALGARGQVTFTMGFAAQLDRMFGQYLNTDGLIESKTTGVTSSISRLTKQQEALAIRLTMVEKRLRNQFTALDTMIGRMTTTSSFLQQQLTQLNANT